MDGSVLISYILNQLQDPELAMNLACHCDLSGAEQQFIDRFHDLLEKGEPSLAAQVAAISPKVKHSIKILSNFEMFQKRNTFTVKLLSNTEILATHCFI